MPYELTPEVEKQILEFKDKNKFGAAELWDERGLIPSPENIINSMEQTVNNSIDRLIDKKAELSTNTIKSIIKEELQNQKVRLDTEEREFLAETFFELCEILQVDIKRELNRYLY